MERLSTLLSKVLRQRGLEQHANASVIVHHAQRWIESELTSYTGQLSAASFGDGVLTIHALSPVGASECQQSLEELRKHLQEKHGHRDVTAIRVVHMTG